MNFRNDWAATLEMANKDLKKYGMKIRVLNDPDEGVYSCDIHDGFEWVNFADNYYENELGELVNDAWAHARAKAKAKGQEAQGAKREPMKLALYKVGNSLGFDRHTFDGYEPKAIEDALQPLLNDDNEAAIVCLEDAESVELFVEEFNNQVYDGYWGVLIPSYESNKTE